MRKAINAAFGGDLIRGSGRSACSDRVRSASACGMASSEPSSAAALALHRLALTWLRSR